MEAPSEPETPISRSPFPSLFTSPTATDRPSRSPSYPPKMVRSAFAFDASVGIRRSMLAGQLLRPNRTYTSPQLLRLLFGPAPLRLPMIRSTVPSAFTSPTASELPMPSATSTP